MEFSGQKYWSGLPFPLPQDLPSPGIEPGSPALQTNSLLSEPPGKQLLIKLLSEDTEKTVGYTSLECRGSLELEINFESV